MNILKNALLGGVLGGLASLVIPFLGIPKGAFIGALLLVIIGAVRKVGR